jgi:hypothetical protein
MSGLEWMVLVVGLGLGWAVVSMLTGQRKRADAPQAAPAPEDAPTEEPKKDPP